MQVIDHETGEITERELTRGETIALLEEEFPPQALKTRSGGGNRVFTYVSTDTVIRRLNKATDNNWSFRIVHEATRFLDGGTNRNNGTVEQVMMVYGELTIPGYGTRGGYGVQRLANPILNTDDLLKAAAGDALKRAAVSFGVAIDLYGPDLEAGETGHPVAPEQIAGVTRGMPPRPQPPPQQPARSPQPPMQRPAATDRLPAPRQMGSGPGAPGMNPEGQEEYPYERPFDLYTKMDQVKAYLAECGITPGGAGNMNDCRVAVNQFVEYHYGVKDAVKGSGLWNAQYKRNDLRPADIVNALSHFLNQNADGAAEAKAAEERDIDPEEVPF